MNKKLKLSLFLCYLLSIFLCYLLSIISLVVLAIVLMGIFQIISKIPEGTPILEADAQSLEAIGYLVIFSGSMACVFVCSIIMRSAVYTLYIKEKELQEK